MFFWNTCKRTHELLPCGLEWRKLVKLFKKPKSKFCWYDFTVRSKRYRGSTQEKKAARAGKIAGLKLVAALQGSDPVDRKAPTLWEFSLRFFEWVKTGRLEFDTQRYYRNGWRLLNETPIAGMKLDHITADDAEALRFPGIISSRLASA